ncbi:ATP-dependent DNA/RNA helicase [Ascoidea rubescens DSM 1968]|uniref:ATP-dependent RNA helicase DBP9 n=1 Tax=Ascoidea rubescens DSM 1968 TaxID=1344418 RepID=A0A1D2VF76_9ASCO|nr:DEAD-domain-containing protein [Ascoidea rubescens DSM 1968]ODV60275.1 DEAD-domain-containing protein [Ascoidea rubescens DSM 1968]
MSSNTLVAAEKVYIDQDATFDSFNLDPRLLQAINHLGFENPTLVQSKVISMALNEKKDVIAKATTGSGKTAAYVIPIIQSILEQQSQLTDAKSNSSNHQVKAIILVPTKELSNQVYDLLNKILIFCSNQIKFLNLSDSSLVNDTLLSNLLLDQPEIIISTPTRLLNLINNGAGNEKNVDNNSLTDLIFKNLSFLAIDEVDLMFSYGYKDDLNNLEELIRSNRFSNSNSVQSFLMTATLNDDLELIKSWFTNNPVTLKLNDSNVLNSNKLFQYYIKSNEFNKFLIIYIILKLNLVKGKILIFVNNIDRSYRLKLFLEQFSISSSILNSELPINSRLSIINQFNKNIIHLLIATDESNYIQNSTKNNTQNDNENNKQDDNTSEKEPSSNKQNKQNKKIKKTDSEYSVSRGVDFHNVACVLNFDLPTTSTAYIHRIGRTARGDKSGMALSFVVDSKEHGKHKQSSLASAKYDEKVLERIIAKQKKYGLEVNPYNFNMEHLENFRYRCEDAFRAVTNVAIREARVKEIKLEILNNAKLKRHFNENPNDLDILKHDKELHPSRVQPHLKRVPNYLLPANLRKDEKLSLKSFVPHKHNKKKLKFKNSKVVKNSKKLFNKNKKVDPLKSLKF